MKKSFTSFAIVVLYFCAFVYGILGGLCLKQYGFAVATVILAVIGFSKFREAWGEVVSTKKK